MAFDFDGVDQSLVAAISDPGTSWSCGCRFNSDSDQQKFYFTVGRSVTNSTRVGFANLLVAGDGEAMFATAEGNSGANTGGDLLTAMAKTDGVWGGVVYETTATNAHNARFYNGTSFEIKSSIVDIGASTLDRVVIGASIAAGTIENWFDGKCADPFVISGTLSTAQKDAYLQGISIEIIAPDRILFGRRLLARINGEFDYGGHVLTNNNGATVSPHPTFARYPTSVRTNFFTPAAATGRIMGALAGSGGLAGAGGLAGHGGGLAG